MKKILTVFMSAFVLFAFAQERVPDGPKEKVPVGERQCPSFVMTPLDNVTVTTNTLIEAILGADITSYNLVNFQGRAVGDLANDPTEASAGLFSGGMDAGIGLESGIVLSSGFINNAIGPNQSGSISGVLGLPGDAQLTALAGDLTYDATILEFEFVPQFDQIFVTFVFGSDEYPEYVGSFNDVFAFFLNGVNIAIVPGSDPPLPVSINNISPFTNSHLYNNNNVFSGPDYPVFCNEMDGFTTVLTVSGSVNPGETNTIKLAIADAIDEVYDSWVFIGAEGFTGINPEIPVSNWALYLGILLMVTFIVIRFRRMI